MCREYNVIIMIIIQKASIFFPSLWYKLILTAQV